MKKYYSMRKIAGSLPVDTYQRSSVWVNLWVRRFSFLVTWVMINLGWSANATSVLSIFVALAGAVSLATGYYILGAILINLWLVLDCVDGNIARVKGQKSHYGAMIDAFGGYYTLGFLYLACGIAAYGLTGGVHYIVLGAVASISDILARLLSQKYNISTLLETGKQPPKKTGLKRFSAQWLKTKIDVEIGFSGVLMPALILSAVFQNFTYFIYFYFLFTVLVLVYFTVLFIYKGDRATRVK